MNLEGFSLSNVCRLCLRPSKDLKNIFAEEDSGEQSNTKLSARIMACVSLEILPTDRGPHTVCDKCLESVNSWYEFNEVCHVSNALLSKYLNGAPDYSRRNVNQTSDKSNTLNESSILPEISLLSHDSLLDRSFGLDSNISPIRDFCISPTPYKLDSFTNDVSLGELVSCRANNFVNVIPSTSNATVSFSSDVNVKKFPKTPKKKGYDCEFCKLTFARFSGLLGHDSKEHITMVKQVCSICGRLFVSADRLTTHKSVAHRERSFRCELCAKMFSSRKSLSVHQRLHSGQYKCESCGFVSTSKLYLTQHLKRHAGGVDTFECSTCNKRFSHRSSLLRHENLHLVDRGKVFRCSVCHLSVRSAGELTLHLATHQSVVEKRHRCHICHRYVKSKKILSMHLRRHQPAKLTCEICDKKLFSRHELGVHRETHSDCKAYVCFHCDKRFSFKNTLVRHLKKHFSRIRSDAEV